MLHLAFTVVLPLWVSSVHGQDTVLFPSENRIHGTTMMTRNGRNISAYLGIPYAKPPVGPLRFRSPQPFDEEDRDIVADTDGNQCPQLNDDGSVVGDEDCLYLNVYTPPTESPEPYPTMVYFHGGDFVKGSGSSIDAGPEYLLDRDIVLVTVNYRLGVLGFLSTGDAESPGNFGLKDQVVALQWVQDNIFSFEGNPWKVTIFGEGAGGASTSLHAMFSANKDLFHQYISQSASAMSFWAFHYIEDYRRRATELGVSELSDGQFKTFVLPMYYQTLSTLNENETGPVYYYSFNYRGTFSRTSFVTGNNENIGVTHGDDRIYLFPMKTLNNGTSDLQLSDSDEKMIDIMVDLWTSFADTGIPTAKSTSDPHIWKTYNGKMMNTLKIGNISDPILSTQYKLRAASIGFWNYLIGRGFYNAYAKGVYGI